MLRIDKFTEEMKGIAFYGFITGSIVTIGTLLTVYGFGMQNIKHTIVGIIIVVTSLLTARIADKKGSNLKKSLYPEEE